MGLRSRNSHALEITLTGSNNRTLRGHLNLTALGSGAGAGVAPDQGEVYDSHGAATFVVVVILVYGLSIVLMIGSLAKKNMKVKTADTQEKQINRYLNQASDLKDKSAKENYRQLKRNIINIVNKHPNASAATATHLSSVVAVDGQPVEETRDPSPRTATAPGPEDRSRAGQRRGRTTSESDSLQALLEEDEPPEIHGSSQLRAKPQVTPDSGVPDASFGEVKFKHPKDTVVSAHKSVFLATISLVSEDKSDENDGYRASTGKSCHSQKDPRDQGIQNLVVPEQDTRRKTQSGNFLKPLDINRARSSQSRTYGLERENRIIYNVDESTAQGAEKSCKLSMDVDGNIWILQSSPTMSRTEVSPSPSASTPGSIGYESFQGITPVPTPSPIPVRIPSPIVHMYHSRPTQDSAPHSSLPTDTLGPSHSKHSYPDSRTHPVGAKTVAARRSPKWTPESVTKFPRSPPPPRVRYATSSPGLDRSRALSRQLENTGFVAPTYSIGDSDEEELVQITSL